VSFHWLNTDGSHREGFGRARHNGTSAGTPTPQLKLVEWTVALRSWTGIGLSPFKFDLFYRPRVTPKHRRHARATSNFPYKTLMTDAVPHVRNVHADRSISPQHAGSKSRDINLDRAGERARVQW